MSEKDLYFFVLATATAVIMSVPADRNNLDTDCRRPLISNNSSIVPDKPKYNHSDVIIHNCIAGYKRIGPRKRRCFFGIFLPPVAQIPTTCLRRGVWSSWGDWNICSKSCGGGFKHRNRTCITDSPGRLGCVGRSSDVGTCRVNPCPYWTKWTQWAECSELCGEGYTYRSRQCVNGVSWQEGCGGHDWVTDRCIRYKCPRVTPGQWSECSVSCGGGLRRRNRTCETKHPEIFCLGGRVTLDRTDSCNIMPCPAWSSWGDWSGCSETCGTRSRERNCTRGNVGSVGCDGNNTENDDCANE